MTESYRRLQRFSKPATPTTGHQRTGGVPFHTERFRARGDTVKALRSRGHRA
jgi:hypothetical protein